MDNQFEFLVYRTAEEDISINAVVKDETIWLTQKPWASCSAWTNPPSADI